MTEEKSLDVPSSFDIDLQERFQKIIDENVKKMGMEATLRRSMDRNAREIQATVSSVLYKIQSDLILTYVNLVGELRRVLADNHLNLLLYLESDIEEWSNRIQALKAEAEKYEQARGLRAEYEEKERQLAERFEDWNKKARDSLADLQKDIEAVQGLTEQELRKTVASLRDGNSKLREIIYAASRQVREMGYLGLDKAKSKVLDTLGEALNV